MNIVPVEITGRSSTLTDARSWSRSRVEAAAREAIARGVASGAPANITATIAVALWANETGWGASERRYNVGSVHCVESTPGDCMRLRDGELLRAYARLDVAVSEWFGLIQSEYPAAWAQLVAGDLAYWSTLQRQGYGGHVQGSQAVQIYRRVCEYSGFAGYDAAEERAVLAAWSRGSGSSSSSTRFVFGALALGWLSKAAGWW